MKNKQKILILCALLVLAFIATYDYNQGVSAQTPATSLSCDQELSKEAITKDASQESQETEVLFISCNGFFN